MAAHAPAFLETLFGHLHGALADFIDVADIPTAMMQARCR